MPGVLSATGNSPGILLSRAERCNRRVGRLASNGVGHVRTSVRTLNSEMAAIWRSGAAGWRGRRRRACERGERIQRLRRAWRWA